jgi:pilus assembly protein CpaE
MTHTDATRPSPARRIFGLPRRRRLGEDGVSAVEFALFAPILFIALLAMVDVGFAIYERMTLDHVLRAGAQEAMNDPGKARVLAVLNATAAQSFLPADVPIFKVNDLYNPRCECPENKGVNVNCTKTCSGSTETYIFYNLEGEKTYDGIFMPIDLAAAVEVQVR